MLLREHGGHHLGVCQAIHARIHIADTHTHTRRKLREHLDMCHLPRGSHLVYTQYRRGFVPSWMCNLHASLHHWERMEDKVESEERANRVTHFRGIKC